jgi:hypothetical protein
VSARKPLQAMGSHRQVEWNPPPGDSWVPYDIADYLEEEGDESLIERPSTDMLARLDGLGLLYRGRTHDLHGPPESGKSWVALIAVADVLRIPAKPAGPGTSAKPSGQALFLDYEDAGIKEIIGRLLAMGVTPDQIAAGLTYVQPHEPPAGQQWEDLVYQHRDLAVIDAANGALAEISRDANSNADVAVWAKSTVLPLAEGNAAVIVVDHTPLSSNRVIGGTMKKGSLTGASYRVVAHKPLTRGGIGVVDLFVVKDRAGFVRKVSGVRHKDGSQHAARITFDATDPHAIGVQVQPPPAAVEGKAAVVGRAEFSADQVDDLCERLSREVEQAATPPSQNVLAKAVGGDHNDAVAQIRHLVADGYLATERGGRNAILHRSVRPYRTDKTGPR